MDDPQPAPPLTHADRRYTCGACLQSYCVVCQRPACPHPAWQQARAAPAPLGEAELEQLRSEQRMLPDGWFTPQEGVRLLVTLDQERALRQAAETALAVEEQQRQNVEATLRVALAILNGTRTALAEEQLALKAMAGKWMDEVAALQTALAEARQARATAEREAEEADKELTALSDRAVQLYDQQRAALAACEARLAEAERQQEEFVFLRDTVGRMLAATADQRGSGATHFHSSLRDELEMRYHRALKAHPAPSPVEETA